MSLAHTFAGIHNEAHRHIRTFSQARTRHPALAPFERAADLLAALAKTSRLTDADQSAIVLALVSEQQREPHPLYQAILLAAFEPMLRRLRARLGRKHDLDLDQRVLLAFLEAVNALSVAATPTHAVIALRRSTEDAVFFKARVDQRAPRTRSFDERIHGVVKVAAAERVAEAQRLLRTDAGSAAMVDVLLSTCSGDETLKEYVDRAFAHQSEIERRAVYENLRTARRRVLERLRRQNPEASAA